MEEIEKSFKNVYIKNMIKYVNFPNLNYKDISTVNNKLNLLLLFLNNNEKLKLFKFHFLDKDDIVLLNNTLRKKEKIKLGKALRKILHSEIKDDIIKDIVELFKHTTLDLNDIHNYEVIFTNKYEDYVKAYEEIKSCMSTDIKTSFPTIEVLEKTKEKAYEFLKLNKNVYLFILKYKGKIISRMQINVQDDLIINPTYTLEDLKNKNLYVFNMYGNYFLSIYFLCNLNPSNIFLNEIDKVFLDLELCVEKKKISFLIQPFDIPQNHNVCYYYNEKEDKFYLLILNKNYFNNFSYIQLAKNNELKDKLLNKYRDFIYNNLSIIKTIDLNTFVVRDEDLNQTKLVNF